METLLNELANLLHVSADSVSKIAESYPALRQQYVVYSIMQNLMGITIFTCLFAIASTFFAAGAFIESKDLVGKELENYKWRFNIWFKAAICFFNLYSRCLRDCIYGISYLCTRHQLDQRSHC